MHVLRGKKGPPAAGPREAGLANGGAWGDLGHVPGDAREAASADTAARGCSSPVAAAAHGRQPAGGFPARRRLRRWRTRGPDDTAGRDARPAQLLRDANCQAPRIRDETSQVWTVRWTASHGLGVLCQTAKSMLCHSPSQAWFVLHWIFNTALGSHTNLGHNTAFPGPTKEVTPLQGRSKTEQEAWEDGKTRRKRLPRHCSACA